MVYAMDPNNSVNKEVVVYMLYFVAITAHVIKLNLLKLHTLILQNGNFFTVMAQLQIRGCFLFSTKHINIFLITP